MQFWAFIAATLLGGALGAILQYSLSQRAERQRNLQLRRTEAYVDLIKAVAMLMMAGSGTPADRLTAAHALLGEARARIAVYGSPAVGTALASFFARPIQSAEARQALLQVLSAMRAESAGTDPIPASDLEPLLFATNS